MEITKTRPATEADSGEVVRLLQTALYRHLHVDWHLPGDWLGSPGFVVLPAPPNATSPAPAAARRLGRQRRLRACLAVTAEPPPAAWVRVAAIATRERPAAVLGAMLEKVLPHLREAAVTELGWLLADEWPDQWLVDLGFFRKNWVETYVKDGLSLPPLAPMPEIAIRPVRAQEMDVLAGIEREAFPPLWRYDRATLALVYQQALSFDVVTMEGQIVAFQFSSRANAGAHLVRLAVRPDCQGRGVGAALLAHTVHGYRRLDLRRVSLNTQIDNVPSQRLYRKFGFYATGQRLPVWVKALQEDNQ